MCVCVCVCERVRLSILYRAMALDIFQTGVASIIILRMEICKADTLQISIVSIIIDAIPV